MIVRSVLSTAFAVMTVAPCLAQHVRGPLVDVDCSAYRREDNGTWVVNYPNRIVLGSNVDRRIVPADDPRSVELTPYSRLAGVLDATCGRLKR